MNTPTTIAAAAAALRRGAVTATALLDSSLAAIDEHGERTNAFILVDRSGAEVAAHAADAERRRGVDRGPLHGVPISIKDLIDMAGLPTTAASRAMPEAPATTDASLIRRLREAGAVLIGKTNLHEFALGTTSDESGWGPVRHPADPERSPGGSSGGSAVAVATGMGLGSIGTDTGGSIRIPASACGIVGLKPTYGEVPMAGVVPLSTSLDHGGPMTRTVQDAGLLWIALTGGRVIEPPPPTGLRLGLVDGYFDDPLDPAVRSALHSAVEALRRAGAEVVKVSMEHLGPVAGAYVAIVLAEGAAWHDTHVPGGADRYTPGVATRLARGRDVSAVDYLAAQASRRNLRQAVDAALHGFDAIITAAQPLPAPLIGAETVVIDPAGGEPVPVRAAMLKHTQPFNMSGHPAISIPMPVSGLPIGLQLVGPRHATARLLAVAGACERALAVR